MFLNQASRIVSGLVIVALMARILNSETLGVWYIFSAIFGLSSIAEMGLNQVFMRHIAYNAADENNNKLYVFIRKYRVLYSRLVGLIGLVSYVGGFWWIFIYKKINVADTRFLSLSVLWFLYTIGGCLQLYSTFYSAISTGLGEVGKAQRNEVICVFANALLMGLLLYYNFGLAAPVLAFIFSRILLIYLHRLTARSLIGTYNTASNNDDLSISRVLFKDTARMGLIMVSFQLLTNGMVIIFSKFKNSSFIASYGLTFQIMSIVIGLTSFWIGASFPQFATCHITRQYNKLRKLFWLAFTKTLVLLTIGFIVVYLFAGQIVHLFGSQTPLLGGAVLAILLLTAWFEVIVGQFAQLLLSQGNFRYVYMSLTGAVIICTGAWSLFSMQHDLNLVLWYRFLAYFVIVSLPILFMSKKYLYDNK